MRRLLVWLYDEFLDETTWTARLIAIGIASAYVLAAIEFGDTRVVFRTSIGLVWPIAFILGADYFAAYRGWGNLRLIDRDTPAIFIRGAGWFLLVLPIIVLAIRVIVVGLNK